MIHIEAAGMDGLLARAAAGTDHVHVVDGGVDRSDVYDHFVEDLGLPEHFGRNLDALMDSLRDVADLHQSPWTLVWRPGHAAGPDGTSDQGILGVLSSLEEEYPDLSVVIADR